MIRSLLSVHPFQTASVLPACDQRRDKTGQVRAHIRIVRIARRVSGGSVVPLSFFFREFRSVPAPFSSTVITRIWS